MLRIVLPLTAAALAAVDVVSVEIVVVVNVDVAAVVPVTIAPVSPYASRNDASTKGQSHTRQISRVGIGVIRIGWRAIDHLRVIRRDVNYVRT
jgi:hypothetical protein